MSLWRLVACSLAYYRWTGIVAAAAVAVAAAALTGSLLVGASVSGSVRDMALARLGRMDHALVAPHYFRAALAEDLKDAPALAGRVRRLVPAILSQGAAVNADSGAAVPGITILGVDAEFARLFPGGPPLRLGEFQVAVNGSLARDLGARAGDAILANVDRQGAVAFGSLFARRKREETVLSLRATVAAVLPDAGTGGFQPGASTIAPRNVFISRTWLASELDRAGLANALFVESKPTAREADDRALREALAARCSLADYGLAVVLYPERRVLLLQSAGLVLNEAQVRAARAAAAECEAQAGLTSINLATAIREAGAAGPGIAYAIVAGTDPLAPFRFAAGGGRALGRDDLWLNRWAAEDLKARPGDLLEVDTVVPSWDGVYRTATRRFRLRGVVEMEGPGADRTLVPDIRGITDAEQVDRWAAPFPVDMSRVTPRDEEYWKRYRAAPKAFVSLDTARALWQQGEGQRDWVSSVRIRPRGAGGWGGGVVKRLPGALPHHLATSPPHHPAPADTFASALLRHLHPEDAGMVFRPVRRLALAASSGSTDFGQLFVGMSIFLVLSAAGLSGMAMRLLAQRRAGQAGILLACGFREGSVRRALLAEGCVLAALGTLAGTPLGVLYAWAILRVLATRWIGAVNTTALWLHVEPASLAAGALSGLAVGVLSAWWGSRQVARRAVLELLAGWQSLDLAGARQPARRVKALLWGLPGVAGLLVLAGAVGRMSPQGAFFGGGSLLLLAGLCGSRLGLGRAMARRADTLSLGALAVRGAAANPGRSLLVVGLFACASFLLVAVGANQRDVSQADVSRRDSGTGGFALRAVSALPIQYDFGTPEGRARLGFPSEDEETFRGVQVMPLLMSPGEDASCLNLARPQQPRVLGVGRAMVARRGFRVVTRGARPDGNPWRLLEAPGRGGEVPAFGDAESVQWILHSGLGKAYRLLGGDGRSVTLRFAGLLPGSIFAGELLVSEEQFRRIFPAVAAPRYYLIAAPAGREEKVAQCLRRNLGELGLSVRSTREVLNAIQGVQNTYLSTFLALGGLGMLLGTLGLVMVILRSALERRGELALMLAAGFRTGDLARMLVLENAGLLLVGLVCGVACALVAVAPALGAADVRAPWGTVAALLGSMLILGLACCTAASHWALRGDLIPALREE